jgi:EmrB/QacA subfamily drug resistance transporter
MALMLDSTVVNVALPVLREDLDASTTELQWIPNAYLLVIAALVVTAGRIGDLIGRRRAFLAGLVLFGVGAVMGGLAEGPETVIAARAVMGAGAAFLLPLSLTLVNDAFPAEERGRAMGIWAAVSSLALAIGPLAGGTLAQLDWRLIFWINVPIVVAGWILVRSSAEETRDETAPPKLDIPGFLLLAAGLGAVTLGFAQAEDWGWTSAATLGTIAAGLASLAAFWVVEHRVSNPIVEFDLFRNKPYLGASGAAFALVGSYWVVMFFQPQYLQDILDYSPLEAGLLILPITLPMVLLSPIAHRFVDRFGDRNVMGCGMLLGLAGLIVMTRIDGDTGYGVLFVGYTLFGLALGFVYAPMQTAAMEAMPQAKAGIAAGVLAMNRILSGALSLAITASIFHTILASRIEDKVNAVGARITEGDARELEGLANGTASAKAELASQPPELANRISDAVADAFSYALSTTLWFPALLVAIGAAITWAYVRGPDEEQEYPSVGSWAHAHLHWRRGRYHL